MICYNFTKGKAEAFRMKLFQQWNVKRNTIPSPVLPNVGDAARRKPFVIQHSISLIICSFNQRNEKSTEA